MMIGDGYAVLGCSLEPAIDSEGNLSIVLSLVGGRDSVITGMQPVKLPLGELAKIPVAKVQELLAKAMAPVEEPAP